MSNIEYFGQLENTKNDLALFEIDPLIMEPVSVVSFINKKAKLKAFTCPAVTGYLKNTFYICSPLDLSIVRNDNGSFNLINSRDPTIDMSSFLLVGYPDTELLDDRPVITILLQYTFINNDDDITMEVIDPPLTNLPLTNIPGEFNISKWIRPTNFCFFIDPHVKQLDINRGDPLYAVRFRSKKNKNVKLTQVLDEARRVQILTEQKKALSLKKFYPYAKLNEVYEMFTTRMKSLWK